MGSSWNHWRVHCDILAVLRSSLGPTEMRFFFGATAAQVLADPEDKFPSLIMTDAVLDVSRSNSLRWD
jgi:hypothetical protein